jgi:hypothetical protein
MIDTTSNAECIARDIQIKLEKICVPLFADMETNGFDPNNVSDDDLLLVVDAIRSALLKSRGIHWPLQDAAQEYARCLKRYQMDRDDDDDDDDGAGQSQGPDRVH